MARFFLVRHAEHNYLSRGVAGRKPGIHLNQRGQAQAQALAERLSGLRIEAVLAGPLERARETAEPLTSRLNLTLEIAPEFDEIDLGDWTGCTFTELEQMTAWQQWNAFRSSTTPPGGESMLQAQTRAVGKILQLQQQRARASFAIFSHGDVIRATLVHFLGLHLDFYARFQIDPASISVFDLEEQSVLISTLNSKLLGEDPWF